MHTKNFIDAILIKIWNTEYIKLFYVNAQFVVMNSYNFAYEVQVIQFFDIKSMPINKMFWINDAKNKWILRGIVGTL